MDKRSVDDAIREALGRDDPAAVELIWQRYADGLLAYLVAMLCSRHDAEDILQTVFVRIASKRHRLAKAGRLDAYIYRIARNEAVSYMRLRLRNQKDEAPKEPWLAASDTSRERSDLVDLLEVALSRLPEDLSILATESVRDPFSQSSLLYKRQGTGFDLYSVGPDQKDNGGAAKQPRQESDYDLVWHFSGQATP